jgi:hypothetical protein
MTHDEQRALLIAWESRGGSYDTEIEACIDRWLAVRQPPATECHVCHNDPDKYELCSVGHAPPPGYMPLAEARSLADAIGLTVPGVNAPERFWRVVGTGGTIEEWWANTVNGRGEGVGPWLTPTHGRPTRELAEADGVASGLPEWTENSQKVR